MQEESSFRQLLDNLSTLSLVLGLVVLLIVLYLLYKKIKNRSLTITQALLLLFFSVTIIFLLIYPYEECHDGWGTYHCDSANGYIMKVLTNHIH